MTDTVGGRAGIGIRRIGPRYEGVEIGLAARRFEQTALVAPGGGHRRARKERAFEPSIGVAEDVVLTPERFVAPFDAPLRAETFEASSTAATVYVWVEPAARPMVARLPGPGADGAGRSL